MGNYFLLKYSTVIQLNLIQIDPQAKTIAKDQTAKSDPLIETNDKNWQSKTPSKIIITPQNENDNDNDATYDPGFENITPKQMTITNDT